MSNILTCCFNWSYADVVEHDHLLLTEKSSLLAQSHRNMYISRQPASCRRSQEDLVEDIIAALYNGSTTPSKLQQRLESIVHKAGWWDEAIAKKVLDSLEFALQNKKKKDFHHATSL